MHIVSPNLASCPDAFVKAKCEQLEPKYCFSGNLKREATTAFHFT